MSSSLDEEAGLLFGVTADNLKSYFTGPDNCILALAEFSRLIYLAFPVSSTLIGPTSQRNPAIIILSQSESVPPGETDRKAKSVREDELRV